LILSILNSICGVIDSFNAVKSVVFLELKSAVKKKSVIVKRRGQVEREKESERVREVTCVRASYKLRRSWKTTKGGKRWSKQTTCIIDVPVSPASLCLFSSLLVSLTHLCHSALPSICALRLALLPNLYSLPPLSPFPPLKTSVRVFQFPIHSARNPSRRLRYSVSLAHTHTRARSTKSFPLSARRMETQSHTLVAIKSLCALSVRRKCTSIDHVLFCVSIF